MLTILSKYRFTGPTSRNDNIIKMQFEMGRQQLEYILRTIYEYKDEEKYRGLTPSRFYVQLYLDNAFTQSTFQTWTEVFDYLYQIYKAQYLDDAEAQRKLMTSIEDHNNSSYAKNDFFQKLGTAKYLNGQINIEFDDSSLQKLEEREKRDYEIAERYSYLKDRLISLDDIMEIEDTDESEEAKSREREERLNDNEYYWGHEYQDYTTIDDDEAEVERIYREQLLDDMERQKPSEKTKKARGIIKRKKDIKKTLKTLLG